MDLELNGKKVLVTGGSKGIGRAIGRGFSLEGADVVLVSRTLNALDQSASEIREETGGVVETAAVDLSVRGSADFLAEKYPAIDILINNAGDIPRGDLLSIDEDEWRVSWDLKVFGYINLCRQYYRLMKRRGHGIIINVIGAGGERPTADYICGSSANAALMAFTQALGSRSGKDGIRVTGINPGPINTDRLNRVAAHIAGRGGSDTNNPDGIFRSLPFGRAGEPSEVAASAVFLALQLRF